MTTPNGTVADVVEGLVESANERGIKVAGEWRNQSKFHTVDLPARGARVRCELDAKGFLRAVQILDAAPSTSSSTRDSEIRRMACLKAAATFCGGKALNSEVSSQDVLKIADAEAFERWVLKGGGEPSA